jgi:predicted hydrocarbon binding protein
VLSLTNISSNCYRSQGNTYQRLAFNITLKTRQDFANELSELLFYISAFGYGIGQSVEQGGEFVFRITDPFAAEYLKDKGFKKPACHSLAGILAAAGAQAYGELLAAPWLYSCVETKCVAIGVPYCE